ncbi:MAG: hypothetical protein JXL97_05895 [Bacteroidales bacterium]|nr:hypothetical protein [Bacteroidales bacterium]
MIIFNKNCNLLFKVMLLCVLCLFNNKILDAQKKYYFYKPAYSETFAIYEKDSSVAFVDEFYANLKFVKTGNEYKKMKRWAVKLKAGKQYKIYLLAPYDFDGDMAIYLCSRKRFASENIISQTNTVKSPIIINCTEDTKYYIFTGWTKNGGAKGHLAAIVLLNCVLPSNSPN